MIRLIFPLTIIVAFLSKTFALDCRSRDQFRLKAHITNRGLEKIILDSLQSVRPYIDAKIKGRKASETSSIPQNNPDCLDLRKWEKMGVAESWKKCRGLPRAFAKSQVKDPSAFKAAPVDIKYDWRIDDIEVTPKDVKCDDLECGVEFEVRNLELNGSLSATDRNLKEKVFGVNRVRVKGGDKDRPLKLKLLVKIDPYDLKNITRVVSKDFSLETENAKISIDALDEKGQSMQPEAVLDRSINHFSESFRSDMEQIQKTVKKKYGSGSKAKKELRARVAKLRKSYIEKVEEHVNEELAKESDNFNSEMSRVTFLFASELATDGNDRLRSSISDLIDHGLGEVLANNLPQFINSYLINIPFIHTDTEVNIPAINLQEEFKSNQLNAAYYQIISGNDECFRNIQRLRKGHSIYCPDDFTYRENDCSQKTIVQSCKLKKMEKLIESFSQSSHPNNFVLLGNLEKYLDSMRDSFDGFKIHRESLLKIINNLAKSAKRSMVLLDRNISKAQKEYGIKMSLMQVEKGKEVFDLFIGACSSGCTDLELARPVGSYIPKIKKPYDIAGSIDIRNINKALQTLHEKGSFDLCLERNKLFSCDRTSLKPFREKYDLKKPPEIKWDEKNKTFILAINDLKRSTELIIPVIGMTEISDIKIPFRIVPSDNGKGIKFEISGDVKSSVDFDISSLIMPVLLTAVQPYAGLAYMVAHTSIHDGVLRHITSSKLEKKGEFSVELTEKTPLSKIVAIKTNGKEIYFYGSYGTQ